MTYLIEYLGEFEFIFEIILAYESGDQMGSFDAKKSHAWAPLSNWYGWTTFCSNHTSLQLTKTKNS